MDKKLRKAIIARVVKKHNKIIYKTIKKYLNTFFDMLNNMNPYVSV